MAEIEDILSGVLDLKDEFEEDDEYLSFLNNPSISDSEYPFEDDEEEDIDMDNIDMIDKQIEVMKEQEKRDKVNKSDEDYWQAMLFPEKKTYRSIILEFFPTDLCIELEKISRSYFNDNNTKMLKIYELLDQYKVPYTKLGTGTNRLGIMVDSYAVKIAYDKDGKIDNKREFIYSLALQPYVVKTYEVSETGLFSVCEYVKTFEESDFSKYKNQNEMRKILKDIASKFLVGDVGLTVDNYANWGIRYDGSLCILDYAYIYSVSYKQFTCSCDGSSILYYDNDFINLICPRCGKKYPFPQLRKKISRKDQEDEIGDVTKKGYIIHKPEEELDFNHKFVLGATDKIMKKIIKAEKKAAKNVGRRKVPKQDWESDDKISMDEILSKIENGGYENEQEEKENN